MCHRHAGDLRHYIVNVQFADWPLLHVVTDRFVLASQVSTRKIHM